MNCGFLSRVIVCSLLARALERASHRRNFAVARARAGTDSPSQNFLRRTAQKGAPAGVFGRKTHESAASDSLRRRTRECLALAHDTGAGEIFANARRRARNFSRANAESGRAQI